MLKIIEDADGNENDATTESDLNGNENISLGSNNTLLCCSYSILLAI